jgi:RHS repeat-associated protein
LTANDGGVNIAYSANSLNQYSTVDDGTPVSLTYDLDGNITNCELSAMSCSFTWNAENQLVGVQASACSLEMKYDYMSRRIEKKVLNGDVVVKNLRFVYDGYKLIEILDGLNSNSVLQKIVWNGETPFSITDTASSITYYYVLDANKNVSDMIDTSGTVRAHYEYSPFGKIIAQSGDKADENPIRFSSEYFDEELGLVYYNFRYYSPELGRWLSRDPIEEQGGYNIYAMVGNAPVNFWDYLGFGYEEDEIRFRTGQPVFGEDGIRDSGQMTPDEMKAKIIGIARDLFSVDAYESGIDLYRKGGIFDKIAASSLMGIIAR